jgi:filamentous hemagglutinin
MPKAHTKQLIAAILGLLLMVVVGNVAVGDFGIAPVRTAGTSGASNVNAQAALRSKLSAMENAQNTAARTRTLPDGRIRYYGAETPARTAGPTRGASYVTEYNPRTGQVRSWMESYDHAGNVTRVHPKMINGQTVNAPHYPPTGKELGQ